MQMQGPPWGDKALEDLALRGTLPFWKLEGWALGGSTQLTGWQQPEQPLSLRQHRFDSAPSSQVAQRSNLRPFLLLLLLFAFASVK